MPQYNSEGRLGYELGLLTCMVSLGINVLAHYHVVLRFVPCGVDVAMLHYSSAKQCVRVYRPVWRAWWNTDGK